MCESSLFWMEALMAVVGEALASEETEADSRELVSFFLGRLTSTLVSLASSFSALVWFVGILWLVRMGPFGFSCLGFGDGLLDLQSELLQSDSLQVREFELASTPYSCVLMRKQNDKNMLSLPLKMIN